MDFSIRKENVETLIIGNGLSGLCSGLSANKHCDDVLIVSKCYAIRSHSTAAAGGINAAFNGVEKDLHFRDTLKSAEGLGKEEAIRLLCENSDKAISFFEEAGTLFSRKDDGSLDTRAFGGHGEKRTFFVKDRTGLALMQTALEQAEKSGIRFLDGLVIFKLLFSEKENCCYGAVGIDLEDFSIVVIFAENTVIATGGACAIFETNSNGVHSCGDGFSLALECGLPLLDIEMIQFHPTGLYPSGILISEAARGEGGVLLNSLGKRFMFDYDSKGELAKRDVVTKAILKEIEEGRGCGKYGDYILLDCINIKYKSRLPEIRELASDFQDCDIEKECIKIRPTAHYFMGGIFTDTQCRVLNRDGLVVNGLFAVGECANVGVHGANRLGGNSLLETIVFGFIFGESLKNKSNSNGQIAKSKKDDLYFKISEEFKNIQFQECDILKIKEELKHIVEKEIGIVKDENLLKSAKIKLKNLKTRLEMTNIAFFIQEKNNLLLDFLETKASINLAIAICEASLKRDESRGAFIRKDKNKKSKMPFNTLTYFDKDCIKSEKIYD